jgi:hypothetical protein
MSDVLAVCPKLFGALFDLAQFASKLGVFGSQIGQGVGVGHAAWYDFPALAAALLWWRLLHDTGTFYPLFPKNNYFTEASSRQALISFGGRIPATVSINLRVCQS